MHKYKIFNVLVRGPILFEMLEAQWTLSFPVTLKPLNSRGVRDDTDYFIKFHFVNVEIKDIWNYRYQITQTLASGQGDPRSKLFRRFLFSL